MLLLSRPVEGLTVLLKHLFFTHHPQADRAIVKAFEDQSLGKQVVKGLVHRHQPAVKEDLGDEPGIDQVFGGVFRTSDILIHRHPGPYLFHVKGGFRILRINESQEIPGRIHKGVHGVGVPAGRALAPGAPGFHELRDVFQGGTPRGFIVFHVGRKEHRKVLLRHGDDPAPGAVDHGDGGTPVALAGNQPVPEAIAHGGSPEPPLFQIFLDGPDALLRGKAREGAGVHHHTLFFKGFGHLRRIRRLAVSRTDHHPDGEVVFPGEFKVPLIVGRHAHHHARAVVSQHIVPHPDGDGGLQIGMPGIQPREHPGFLFLLRPFPLGLLQGLVNIGLHLFPVFRRHDREEFPQQGMFGGDGDEGHAEKGVGPGGEDRKAHLGVFHQKVDLGALAFADPVFLLADHRFRPLPPEFLKVLEEAFGIGGDFEKPLLQFPSLHRGFAPFAGAVFQHLLVGQHRFAGGAIVHKIRFAIGQTPVIEIEEKPLRPAVIFRVAGGDLPIPVIGKAHQFEVVFEGGDVVVSPFPGVHPELDGGVFGRQAEGVPPHGVEDLKALHFFQPGHHVANGIVFQVSHVEVAAGGIGEHLQDVIFGFLREIRGAIEPALLPEPLPFRFNLPGVIGAHPQTSVLCGLYFAQKKANLQEKGGPPHGDGIFPGCSG